MNSGFSSLYFHFPFCESKCHYCDFYSLGKERTKLSDADLFERAILKETIASQNDVSSQVATIFCGGGTPSMTPPESMERIFAPIRGRIKNTEWTMEANPSSVTYEKMRAYKTIGINRVSLGVQATQEKLLKDLGRVHDLTQVERALDSVFSAGITNVSTDLLCGVPEQTESQLVEAMEMLQTFPITHLSIYLLTLPKHHAMYKSLPSEDVQLRHLLLIHDFMVSKGFEHYEISNFAKPGFQAKHNLVYWTGGSYLGLGPSAHSYCARTRRRWKNISSLSKYASEIEKDVLPRESTEHLDEAALTLERWMLSLRLNSGFPKSWLDTEKRRSRAQIFLEKALLEPHPENDFNYRLTPTGFALSDAVIGALAN